MRALVGSEGSTGAVKGARREILAKVRAERGTSSRSAEVMTGFTVLLVVSMGWLASDGPRAWTCTVSRTISGTRVIPRVGWLPTATTTAAVGPLKAVASGAM